MSLATADGGRPRARDLTEQERAQILVAWNETAASWPTDRLVHERIAEHAARAPDAMAVSDPGGVLTYGELDRRANRLANHLRGLGVGPEERVAVCMESSRELLVAYVGILRAGGAYVPIDPGSPDDRVRFVLEDSGARAALVRPGLEERFAGFDVPVLVVDMGEAFFADESEEAPESGVSADDAVYVIYTSGSTGKPKGVIIEHRNLSNLVSSYHRRLDIGDGDRASMVAGVAFDAAVVDIWPYLTRGASVHVPPSSTRVDPRLLVPWRIEERIDIAALPTALGEAAFLEDWSAADRLRTVIVGGDKLHAAPATEMPFELINSYGPTECTVDSTWFVVETGVEGAGVPAIGRPIENYKAYVVDEGLRPLPVGECGELLIGGAGVARGYLNRSDLSAEKFIADPFSTETNARVYRTGDLACFREDGEIEFHGRIDDQVQIRGFRVEPGEVAVVLREHSDVGAVAVLAREDKPGKVRLVAYVVSSVERSKVLPRLRAFADDRLPSYMVPTFVLVDDLPMTLNGKVDRNAFRPPEEYESWRPGGGIAEPRDDVERKLAEIWRGFLELDEVGVDEGFFDLGGDSLSVVIMAAAVKRELGFEVGVPAFVREPTIAGLAKAIRGETEPASRPTVVPLQPEGSRAPLFCVAGAGGGCHWFGDLARELRADRPFLGLEPTAPLEHGDQTIEALASNLIEQMKSIQPQGPYFLGGYSTGGIVAFEVAQQLRRRGDEVGLLALIEADGGREFTTRAGQMLIFAKNLLHMEAGKAARVILDRAGFALGVMRHKLSQTAETKVVIERIEARKQEDEEAFYAYEPRPYDGDVRIFGCEERPMTAVVDEAYGWGKTVRGKIVSSRVPGDHYSMLGQPNVKTLAEDLQASLDAAEKGLFGQGTP